MQFFIQTVLYHKLQTHLPSQTITSTMLKSLKLQLLSSMLSLVSETPSHKRTFTETESNLLSFLCHFKIFFHEANLQLQNNVHIQLSQFLPKQNNSNTYLKLLEQIFGSIAKIIQKTKTTDTQQSLAEKSRNELQM